MASSILDPSLSTLSRRFEQFAVECRNHGSPLYERLSLDIAADPMMLALAAEARSRPVPNLLFGAVQFLLLKEPAHPLGRFYASLTGSPAPAREAYPSFRAFCLERAGALQEIMSARRVQTNEVRRCACLLPAFTMASRQAGGLPLALVEIGASAGLNLLWDRYGYDYGKGRRYGDRCSPVRLCCGLRGEWRPPLPVPFPQVATRIGLDLAPVDLHDPDAVLWLQALIWPEHGERVDRLRRALEIARQDPPPLLAGDALHLLPGVLAFVPRDAALCVYHSYTLNQFSPEERERLASQLAAQAAERDLWRVSLEWRDGTHSLLELASFRQGVRTDRVLARCPSHGGWIEWIDGE